jgi:hypothetical protein
VGTAITIGQEKILVLKLKPSETQSVEWMMEKAVENQNRWQCDDSLT